MNIKEERISSVVGEIVKLFESGDVPNAVAMAVFPPFDVPSAKWSLLNRIVMAIVAHTSDARGFQQWASVGRNVLPGSKAFYILGPKMVRKGNSGPEVMESTDSEKPQYVCCGFVPIPVFPVEKTEGENLDYTPLELPKFPLLERAREWGIDVSPVSFQGGAYGTYAKSMDKISLATPEEIVFFHELSHAAQQRLGLLEGKKRGNAHVEIVAEISAQAISRLVGKPSDKIGNSYAYVRSFAGGNLAKYLFGVISDVEKVISLVLGGVEVALSTASVS